MAPPRPADPVATTTVTTITTVTPAPTLVAIGETVFRDAGAPRAEAAETTDEPGEVGAEVGAEGPAAGPVESTATPAPATTTVVTSDSAAPPGTTASVVTVTSRTTVHRRAARAAAPVADADRDAGNTLAADCLVRSPREYFATLSQRFQPKAAAGVHATIQFELSGEQAATWHVVVDDGTMKLVRGPASKPDTTIRMKGEDYVKVVNKEWNGTAAVMRGAMKVGGSLAVARKMGSMFPAGAITARR